MTALMKTLISKTKFKNKMKKLYIVLTVISLTLLSSCVSNYRCPSYTSNDVNTTENIKS